MRDLLRLYSIDSVHPNEQAIKDYVCQRLQDFDCFFEETEFGIVGNTAHYEDRDLNFLLSAHLDMVRTNGEPKHFYQDGSCIRGYLDDNTQTSLGADDKNGIWLILKLAEMDLPFKFIMSVGEECGCVGIKQLKIPDADICFVLDRRGYYEVLDSGAGTKYCSTLAQCLCNFWGKPWSTGTGSLSDTQIISQKMESVNISTAYYNPHSATEFTNFTELDNLKEMLELAITNFKHYPTKPEVYNKRYDRGGWYGDRLL